jgi:hypothetical protein
MKGRIQRPVLDLKHILGLPLDDVGHGVPVGRADGERSEDQQVERPLEQISLIWLFFSLLHVGSIILH